MGGRISEESRFLQGRGTGTGADYKPWIKIRELNSKGTATSFPDWKHGRMIQLLSQAELWWYLKLRWNDDVVDIREQFPLEISGTNAAADKLGYRKIQNGTKVMTSDFLVTKSNGTEVVYSIKADRSELEKERTKQVLNIEKLYWNERRVEWNLVFKSDLNPIKIRNIRSVIGCYNASEVYNKVQLIRHLIANKIIVVDMEQPLDFNEIIAKMEESIWKKYSYMLA